MRKKMILLTLILFAVVDRENEEALTQTRHTER